MDRLYRQNAWPSKKLPFGILPSWFCQPLGIHAGAAEAFGAAPLGIPGILPG